MEAATSAGCQDAHCLQRDQGGESPGFRGGIGGLPWQPLRDKLRIFLLAGVGLGSLGRWRRGRWQPGVIWQ